MITTYRARKRQKVGPGAHRLPNELLPELHLARTAHSSLSTGYATEVQIEPQQFIEELVALELEPDLEQRILDFLGLKKGEEHEEPDTTKHPVQHIAPPDKDREQRVPGPRGKPERPAVTKRAARKAPARKAPAQRPAESLATQTTAEGEPNVPLRTLD